VLFQRIQLARSDPVGLDRIRLGMEGISKRRRRLFERSRFPFGAQRHATSTIHNGKPTTSAARIISTVMLRSVSRRIAGSVGESLKIQGNFAQQAQHDTRV
jgi:hypothetical protein